MEVVLSGLSASNHDHPHPSPHNRLPEGVPLLSLTMTNQPLSLSAWLTVPVVISFVEVAKTSFTRTAPSGQCPVLLYASIAPGDAWPAGISCRPWRPWSDMPR